MLVCHYAGRADYWVPLHAAIRRLGAAAPEDARLLAETFADPLTASDAALAELDDQIEQLRHSEDDALIIRTAIAGFYVDRLAGCREALTRVIRSGQEGGAVGTAMMAMMVLAFDELDGHGHPPQSTRTTTAVPWPTPIHAAATPYPPPRRRSSRHTSTITRAADAPSG